MDEFNELIKDAIRLQEIHNRLDNTSNLTEVSEIIDGLTEDEAKKLLKMYFKSCRTKNKECKRRKREKQGN